MARTVKVEYLARVEGEGGLFLKLEGDRVVDVKLSIYEPPRFFEALLRGRKCAEAPDITARICGICPVAYQMSAVAAVEQAVSLQITPLIQNLRRLLYCGEWIESHVLHVAMLHAPDFLGYPDAIAMARDHRSVVEDALTLKRAGNAIVGLVGGREIHPINVRLGGFYRLPTRQEADNLRRELEAAVPLAERLFKVVAGLSFPDYEQDFEFVALRHPTQYPMIADRIVSSRGLDCAVEEWGDHFEEMHVEHSTALHCRLKERGHYLVGPLARYALNFDRLPAHLQEAAAAVGLGPICRNPFQSIVVRMLEVRLALEVAIGLLDAYAPHGLPAVPAESRAGIGHGATEAPRGLLYHRYEVDAEGLIKDALIVPPTSQNQATMELDMRGFVETHLGSGDRELALACERAIRNYDPCISCATHFLKLHIERTDAVEPDSGN